jgi:hypothetical protein
MDAAQQTPRIGVRRLDQQRHMRTHWHTSGNPR